MGLTASAEVTDAIVEALGRQGVQVEQYYAELGHGQQEVSVAYRPVVWAADTQGMELATLNVRHFPMFRGLRPPYRA